MGATGTAPRQAGFSVGLCSSTGLLGWLSGKSPPATQEMQEAEIRPLGGEHPLEKEMATHSSILAWKVPWTESLAGYSPQGCDEWGMTEPAPRCS